MLFAGVDLGGTNIKVALVDENYRIVTEGTRPTNLPRTPESVCDDIAGILGELLEQNNLTPQQLEGVGVACPGTVDNTTGVVRYSNNLDWHQFNMREYMFSKTGFSIALGNDANVAALGEALAGSAKGAESAVIITLGTGVGSGVVLDGKILTGFNGAATEIGHMVIEKGGELCTCGRRGCLECYGSATALIRMTKKAIQEHPDSLMAKMAAEKGKISGRTSFDAMRAGDTAAAAVVDEYISYLATGIANIINIFMPEIISLSGGISNEKENLLVPLREKVYSQIFGGTGAGKTLIETCTLGYKAGLIGAAMLAKQNRHP